MAKDLFYYIAVSIVFLCLQIFVFNHFEIFDMGFCFIYVGILLMLPHDFNILSAMIVGFILGFSMDLFYQSGGIHAAACVLIMFVRPAFLRLVNPKGGYELGMKITISQMGWSWYLFYAFVLVLIHHIIIYGLDAFSFNLLGSVLMNAIFSTVFTVAMIISTQLIAFNSKKI
jgi:hypothetical protein